MSRVRSTEEKESNMQIFYAPPSQIRLPRLELRGQEAVHATRVLRYREGDALTVVDGEGGWYSGTVTSVGNETLVAEVTDHRTVPRPRPCVTLALGILRKRDRLEFAVEKAVELGASAVALFRSEHTVKENVRQDRLDATALAAMKQSGRTWLPPVTVYRSLEEVLESRGEGPVLMAHEKSSGENFDGSALSGEGNLLVLVGPEGGFSPAETELAERHGAELISLGRYRLRAETAVVAALSSIRSLRE